MIYPIVAYGDPVLKKKAEVIPNDFPSFKELVADMFETMYAASGVGLAAPQIGKSLRLFIVDASGFADEGSPDYEVLKSFKKVFVNPQIVEETGVEWAFNEGCLSIPEIREDVFRNPVVKMQYQDENFETHIEVFEGIPARIIQHEYDHIEGVLFTDRLSALRKRLLKGRLLNISKGKVQVDYKMKFPIR
jgi:peptide deformylase